MTEQEALDLTKNVPRGIEIDGNLNTINKWLEAICIGGEALEKQIPKEPIYEGDGYVDGEMVYDTWRCPSCDKSYEVDIDDYHYCPNCGQKIKWE